MVSDVNFIAKNTERQTLRTINNNIIYRSHNNNAKKNFWIYVPKIAINT